MQLRIERQNDATLSLLVVVSMVMLLCESTMGPEAIADSESSRVTETEVSPDADLAPSTSDSAPVDAQAALPDDGPMSQLNPPSFTAKDPEEVFTNLLDPNAVQSDTPASEELIIPPAVPAPQATHQVEEEVHSLKEADDVKKGLSLYKLSKEPYSNYRTEQSSWTWLPGSGEDFGWLSFQGNTNQPRGKTSGFTGNFGMHLLGGPMSSPIPARLYDFAIGYQVRDKLSHRFSYDLATSIGVHSDLEDSARDGVRFPSHAVGMFHINESADLIFGIDYLSRDDISVLPVLGFSFHDAWHPGLRFDLVFPRPRINYVLTDEWQMYLAGSLEGGTWDIEFPDQSNQVMTYRDYRLVLGFEKANDDGGLGSWELGYVFGRQLEFRNNPAATQFDDAFVMQWVWRK